MRGKLMAGLLVPALALAGYLVGQRQTALADCVIPFPILACECQNSTACSCVEGDCYGEFKACTMTSMYVTIQEGSGLVLGPTEPKPCFTTYQCVPPNPAEDCGRNNKCGACGIGEPSATTFTDTTFGAPCSVGGGGGIH